MTYTTSFINSEMYDNCSVGINNLKKKNFRLYHKEMI